MMLRRAVFGLLVFMLSVPLAGCLDGGLLITPVSTRRELVEQELHRDSFFASSKIALIDVSGLILNMPAPRLIGEGENQVSLLLEQLDMARRDDGVKAVILRINSPGGGVVASELIHDEIKHFRKTTGKPVTAVMMDVAASGGYYIACACDEIVAQPSTVTGSIGVIMQLFDVSGTMEMIGITSNAITSGSFKDAGSPFHKLSDEQRTYFQTIVNDMFNRFVRVVVDGRPKLTEEKVRTLADGRVYTATQALELGLIDRIATMRDTIGDLKGKIGAVPIQVVTYHRPLGYKPNYYAEASSSPVEVNLLKLGTSAIGDPFTPQFLYLWAPTVPLSLSAP